MTPVYQGAMEALRAGHVVILTPGIDQDGDTVMCTSAWEMGKEGDEYLLDADPEVRAAFLISVARIAHDQLRECHGIDCA